jgi:hypothetical protein
MRLAVAGVGVRLRSLNWLTRGDGRRTPAPKKENRKPILLFSIDAEPETRTRKSLRTLEPESSASTNSASTANELPVARISIIGFESHTVNIKH